MFLQALMGKINLEITLLFYFASYFATGGSLRTLAF